MTPQLIIAAVIAAAGFGAGWHLQTLRYTAKERDREQSELAQVRDSAAASIRRADNVIAAQNAATARSVAIRRDRDSAYAELDRLRAQLAQPMPGTGDTATACVEPGSKRNDVLLECLASYEALARDADLWKNDALMLRDAWPK